MTTLALVFFVSFGAFAVADWTAVATKNKTLEYACKPSALGFLVLAGTTLDPDRSAVRWWFVAALALSLVGDVFLMLPTDRFIEGLASFFAAHVAYIVGFVVAGIESSLLIAGAVAVAAVGVLIGRRVVSGARERDPRLGAPVIAYIAVLAAMVAFALASENVLALAGAVLFMLSDSLIGWNRFVRAADWAPVAIIVTYHLAQAGLVTSLI